jgi:GrpB-like predicted nucleotidyltransferase (UPF0157 family)
MNGSYHDEILVVDYDPKWPGLFHVEATMIRAALEGRFLSIEHIGSTAVPGLCAKPVIDIMISVSDIGEFRERHQELADLGYVYMPFDDDGDRLFFRKGMPRTHHLHVVLDGSEVWEHHIRFRDLLHNDVTLRERYSQLKRESAARHRNDRQAYLDSKRQFIEEALQRTLVDPK